MRAAPQPKRLSYQNGPAGHFRFCLRREQLRTIALQSCCPNGGSKKNRPKKQQEKDNRTGKAGWGGWLSSQAGLNPQGGPPSKARGRCPCIACPVVFCQHPAMRFRRLCGSVDAATLGSDCPNRPSQSSRHHRGKRRFERVVVSVFFRLLQHCCLAEPNWKRLSFEVNGRLNKVSFRQPVADRRFNSPACLS